MLAFYHTSLSPTVGAGAVCLPPGFLRGEIQSLSPCETSGIWRFPSRFLRGMPWMSQCCERVSTGGRRTPDRGTACFGALPWLVTGTISHHRLVLIFSWTLVPAFCVFEIICNAIHRSLLVFTVALCNPLFWNVILSEGGRKALSPLHVYALWPPSFS